MRNLYRRLIFGKNAVFSGLTVLGFVVLIALGCGFGKGFNLSNIMKGGDAGDSSPSNSNAVDAIVETVPPTEVVEGLVKETIEQFKDAVDTGNFEDIHRYASTDFQTTYTAEEMASAFKSYTENKSIVVPLLKKVETLDAEFPSSPSIRTDLGLSILVAQGKFSTEPYGLRFDFEYVMRDGEWKMLKLVINIP